MPPGSPNLDPMAEQKRSFFRPKRRKTLPFGTAHTVMACIREYPPGLDQKSENYAALELGFPLVAFKFHTAKRQSFR